jgi:metal transporter CNNM
MLQLWAESLTWLGIALCISQSAMFSGMNLAMFSLSRLRLEIEVSSGNTAAATVLSMRRDSHFLLTTILWGNVCANVLLTLLSGSVLTGFGAFVFSTFVITFFGEIGPQAYFSRHALKVAIRLMPLLRLYQILLFPIAKPSALLLDSWLGQEGIQYFREHNLRELIRRHIDSPEASDINRLEGLGALNFLSIDDLPVVTEGMPVDPMSILSLPSGPDGPVFPEFSESPDDPFLKAIEASGKKWVIITDEHNEPMVVLDSDEFLRHTLFHRSPADPIRFCHRPVVVKSRSTPLGSVISRLRYRTPGQSDKMIELDVILLWEETKRVITGTDILGRLMEGIADQPLKPMGPSARPAG